MVDKVIYTVVTANYDALKPPAVVDTDIDYIVYSDNPEIELVGPWRFRPLRAVQRNPRVTSRWYKILPHRILPDYKMSLWIDATMEIARSLSAWMDDLAASCPLAIFPHSERRCIYDEAKAVIGYGFEHQAIVDIQMAYYRSQDYPRANGLTENGVIFRRHFDPGIVAAMEDWWRQIKVFSQRDQLSGNYVFWKHGLVPEALPGTVYANEWLRHVPHRASKSHLDIEIAVDEISWLRAAAITASVTGEAWERRAAAAEAERESRERENEGLAATVEELRARIEAMHARSAGA